MNVYEGNLVGTGLKIGIVVARFNEFITSKLLSGALDGLKRHGVEEQHIDVAWVPGAFEIPLVAKKWRSRKNTTLSLHLVPSFAERRAITITYVMK